MTLQVLLDEYIAEHPDGYRYSRFCDLFRNWEGRLPLVMRQYHGGREKLFVDYAGDTVPVVDPKTGEVRDAPSSGGTTQLLVPDNAKVAVIKACLYDPMVNRSYSDMAQHYGTTILPATAASPER
ncbi:transposase [Bradyrhizobium sp. USDA 3315]